MSSHASQRQTPAQPGTPPLVHQLPQASPPVPPATGREPGPAREPAQDPAHEPAQARVPSHPDGHVEIRPQQEIRLEPHVRQPDQQQAQQRGQQPEQSQQRVGEPVQGRPPTPPRGPQDPQPAGRQPAAPPSAAAQDTAGNPPLPVVPAGRPGDAGPLFRGALGSRTSPLRMRHLMTLCAWAAAVTLLGLGVGFWVLMRLMSEGTPFWFEPLIVLSGLVGVAFAIAAFVTIDRRYQPWLYMTGSTVMLGVTIGLTMLVT